MTQQLVDDVLANPTALAEVKTFFRTYPSISDAVKHMLTIVDTYTTKSLANEYIIKLISKVINIRPYYLSRDTISRLDTLHKLYPSSSYTRFRYYAALPFAHLPLETIRGITFVNIYNAFRSARPSATASATLADSPLALASFKSVTKKLSGLDAMTYLGQVRKFTNTKADYIRFILENCAHTQSLVKHLADYTFQYSGPAVQRLDLLQVDLAADATYIVLHPQQFASTAATGMLCLPAEAWSTEWSRIVPPIVGMKTTTTLNSFNVMVWYSYLLVIEYYLALNPTAVALLRSRDTLVAELSKPVYKSQIATIATTLSRQTASFKAVSGLLV